MGLATVDPSGGLILEHRRQHELDLVRLASNGSVDRSFADDGMAEIQLPGKEGLRITSVVVGAESCIILGGLIEAVPANDQPRSAFIVSRLLTDGMLDRHFAKRGWMTTSFPRSVKVNSAQAKLDQQGRLVIAGTANTSEDSRGEFVVARYLMSKLTPEAVGRGLKPPWEPPGASRPCSGRSDEPVARRSSPRAYPNSTTTDRSAAASPALQLVLP